MEEQRVKQLLEELLTANIDETWERAFVEIMVATKEMSVKFEYRYLDSNKELKSLVLDANTEDQLFDLLVDWCSNSLDITGEKWNRIHADFTVQSSNLYYYWDRWHYEELYPG